VKRVLSLSKEKTRKVYLIKYILIGQKQKHSEKDSIRAIIDKGVHDDKSNKQIAKDIRDKEKSVNKFRAIRIATTEVHSVFGEVTDTAIKSSGLQISWKEWGAFLDERTRVNHAIANGQKVREDEKFIVGPDNMRFPGDITASAGNIIFCRCVAFYFTR